VTTTIPKPAEPLSPPDPLRHLTSVTTRTVLRIQHEVLRAVREHLCAQGFVELLPPIIGPVTDPGVRGSKQVDIDYYGHRYKLMTSAILYKQASLHAFDKIFCIAPNVRLEPPETRHTGRHLAEFHQIDVEVAGASREEILVLLEGLIGEVVTHVLTELPAELDALDRDTTTMRAFAGRPFGRMTHADAVAALTGLGHAQDGATEIDWQAEVVLTSRADRPFFVTDYPKGSRGFYDREDCENPGVLRNFDLLMPEGYGELCSGRQRELEYAPIVTRMRETGQSPAKYGWYLDMVRQRIPDSAGFGIGLERLTRYLAGLDAVWQASAYPKLPGVVSP